MLAPISSRNSVPWSAARNRPGREALAPVKAPFVWPKSSLSRRPSGSAPQLSSTNGAPRRGDASCRMRAIRDFPVPLSPVTSTVARVGATAVIVSNTFMRLGSVPTTFLGPFERSRAARSSTFSAFSRTVSSARSTTISISSSSTGFVT